MFFLKSVFLRVKAMIFVGLNYDKLYLMLTYIAALFINIIHIHDDGN